MALFSRNEGGREDDYLAADVATRALSVTAMLPWLRAVSATLVTGPPARSRDLACDGFVRRCRGLGGASPTSRTPFVS